MFWYFFPILQQKVGGLSPSPESGGTYPPVPPCSDAYGWPEQLSCVERMRRIGVTFHCMRRIAGSLNVYAAVAARERGEGAYFIASMTLSCEPVT